MEELWKDIKGYEGIYQVSNLGKVRSLTRPVYNYLKQERILKPRKKENDYLQVLLYKDGKRTHKYIHRLVAEHFIENVYKKEFVNHKDFDKSNNSASNLEWVSRVENFKHYQHSDKWNKTYEKRDRKLASKTILKVKQNKDKIIELHKQSYGVEKIAKKLNLGRDFVSDVLKLYDYL